MPSTTLTNTFSANTKIKSAEVNQNFTDNRTFVGFRARMTSTQSNFTDVTYAKIVYGTEIYDVGDNYASGATSTFTAPVTGYYYFHASAWLDATSTVTGAWYYIAFNVNAGTYRAQTIVQCNDQNDDLALELHATLNLSANDTVIVQLYPNQGSNTCDVIGGQEYYSIFEGHFLGV